MQPEYMYVYCITYIPKCTYIYPTGYKYGNFGNKNILNNLIIFCLVY